MTDGSGRPTILRADRGRARSSVPSSEGLPRGLVRQAMPRLRVLALLYAGVFFLADLFPNLFSAADRAIVFGAVVHWLPGAISIAVALAVAAVLTSPGCRPQSRRQPRSSSRSSAVTASPRRSSSR